MDISHLKVNFLGDSITMGARAELPENSYFGRLQKKYPEATLRN